MVLSMIPTEHSIILQWTKTNKYRLQCHKYYPWIYCLWAIKAVQVRFHGTMLDLTVRLARAHKLIISMPCLAGELGVYEIDWKPINNRKFFVVISEKQSSLLCYKINYECKMVFSIDPIEYGNDYNEPNQSV